MPYFFRPENASLAAEDNFAARFLRVLLQDRPIILTEQELQSLGPREREYFSHIGTDAAIGILQRQLDQLQREDAGAQQAAQLAAHAQSVRAYLDSQAAQTVEDARRILDRVAAQPRRRNPPLRPGASHSNEGDIEPEDL